MDHDSFIGEVQNRAGLASRGEALSATRATLTTLSERIEPGAAENLAAQLPAETAHHLEKVDDVERFGWDAFVERVADREEVSSDDPAADAAFHAQVVVDVVADVVTEGQFDDLRDQLPDDEFDRLFEIAEAEETPGPGE